MRLANEVRERSLRCQEIINGKIREARKNAAEHRYDSE